MKKLKSILKGLEYVESNCNEELKVNLICSDSRFVEKDDIYVAIKGHGVDGHKFIPHAIENGASVIVAENADHFPYIYDKIIVKDTRKALAQLAKTFYGDPSKNGLKIVGITGTNGKTTVASILYDTCNSLGIKSGLLSTIFIDNGARKIPSRLTTPDPITLQKSLSEMKKNGCEYCFMEVSSHALEQKRVEGVSFFAAIFTNISHDHLDYHPDFLHYIEAKKKLFTLLSKESVAIVNKDDKNHTKMVESCSANVKTYSFKNPSDTKIKIIEKTSEGTHFKVGADEFWSRLIGDFNALNIAATYSFFSLLNIPKRKLLKKLSNVSPPEGRFEVLTLQNKSFGIIDYAHTPDALENVLKTIKTLRKSKEEIITVVGCGGGRDKAKRPKMGIVAVTHSDRVVFTSDNPRTETPEKILDDITENIQDSKNWVSVQNRKEAIKTAYALSKPHDFILIAGKGHEKYQIINDEMLPFDDKAELLSISKP